MGLPSNLTSLLRNLYSGQEETVRTRRGATHYFQIGKGVLQESILSPAYLTYIQSTSCEMLGWMIHKLESRLLVRNINNLRYSDGITLMAKSKEELKNLLVKVKEESEKSGLKLSIPKTKIMASGPITSWQIDCESMETVRGFIFLGSKITADGTCSHEISHFLLGR